MSTGLEVHAYVVDRWLPEDKGPGVTLAFVQDGAEGQLHILLSEGLAWQIANEILTLLGGEPDV